MSTDNLTLKVAANIRQLVDNSGESRLAIERGTGIHRHKFATLLTGNRPIDTEQSVKIAAHFGVPVMSLYAFGEDAA